MGKREVGEKHTYLTPANTHTQPIADEGRGVLGSRWGREGSVFRF